MGLKISKEIPKTKENEMVQERMRRKTENKKKAMMKRVEQYIYQIYLNFPSIDCVSIIISSELGHDAFSRFLSSYGDNEYLQLFHDANNIIEKSKTTNDIFSDFQVIFQQYVFPRLVSTALPNARNFSLLSPKLREECFSAFKPCEDQSKFAETIRELCFKIQSECIFILSTNYFGDFLVSKQYTSWRALESSHAIATSSDDIIKASSRANSAGNLSKPVITTNKILPEEAMDKLKGRKPTESTVTEPPTGSNTPSVAPAASANTSAKDGGPRIHAPKFQASFFHHIFHSMKKIKIEDPHALVSPTSFRGDMTSPKMLAAMPIDDARLQSDLSYRAFINVDKTELMHLLNGENWLAPLLSASEGLPIGFGLCTAPRTVENKSSPDSPFLFVNKYFEQITGYKRQHILGLSPFDLLLCNQSDKDAAGQIRDSSIAGQSITSIITCKKSNREIFSNLISIKPIFSDTNRYVYMVAMFVDVTKENDNGNSKMRLAELLMGLLPDEIIMDHDLGTPKHT
jgi:PAS domain S-box-containing protein